MDESGIYLRVALFISATLAMLKLTGQIKLEWSGVLIPMTVYASYLIVSAIARKIGGIE